MRKISLLLSLMATPALAEEPASFSCYFQTGQHFTVVGQANNTLIQWDDGSFKNAASSFQDPWLTVVQIGDSGTFKMAFNVRTKDAFGETTFSDGTKRGGPLWCAFK